MILANDAGFADTEFIKTLGKDADFVISREVWALDLANRNPLIKQVNDLFNSRYKADFTGNSARTFTGLMVMADAINRELAHAENEFAATRNPNISPSVQGRGSP